MNNLLSINDVSNVNEWFPPTHQNRYVEAIVRQSGILTFKQALCFVRLWAYALKYSGQQSPIGTLKRHVGTFPCSHRDAADLFYYDQPRGSERSAGMMIDQLVAKNLVKREPFNGGATRLSLNIPTGFLLKGNHFHNIQLYTDTFSHRNDTALVATFLKESYSFVNQSSKTTSFQIKKALRQWNKEYPSGLRVLRKISNKEPVGFTALFPTHPSCEENFDLPPSSSMHLCTLGNEDPIKVAQPGDKACYAVFIRSWQIKWCYWERTTVTQFLQDTQATLKQMQKAFPNLCDVYAIAIHPRLEDLAVKLEFRPLKADSNTSLRWLYTPLDRLLELDADEVLADFDFNLL